MSRMRKDCIYVQASAALDVVLLALSFCVSDTGRAAPIVFGCDGLERVDGVSLPLDASVLKAVAKNSSPSRALAIVAGGSIIGAISALLFSLIRRRSCKKKRRGRRRTILHGILQKERLTRE